MQQQKTIQVSKPSESLAGESLAGESLAGEIVLGSAAHRHLFCRMLLDTHDPYKPAVIPWPALDAEALGRLTALPIWNIAVQIEGRASIAVKTYAETLADPLLREAMTLNAFEEARHKLVLGKMTAFYGMTLEPEPPYPAPRYPEWAFLRTGYAECIDSFFAFGLFEIARRSGFFPEKLVETFEPVIQEEARHILFFVNWLAWHRRQLSLLARVFFNLRCLCIFTARIMGRVLTALEVKGRGGSAKSDAARDQKNFTISGSRALAGELSVATLLGICLAENDRRMAGYDQRLIRPRFIPRAARLALRFLTRKDARR